MKQTLSLTLFLLFASMAAFAQSSNRSMLKIRLSDRSPVSISLDGHFINQETTRLTLDGIRPGIHRIEVYSQGFRRRPLRIYTGTIRLEAGTVNVGIVDVYNHGMRLRTRPADERDIVRQGNEPGDREQQYPRDDRDDRDFTDRENADRRNDDVYGGNRSNNDDARNDNNPGHTEGQGSFPHGRDNMNIGRGAAFSQRDMDDLRSRVAARITDSDKEALMKTALQSRRFSTDQTRQMLSWLSFESTRLDFAKWAMPNVTDRDNFWKLEDMFDFSSSKKEFSEAIR